MPEIPIVPAPGVSFSQSYYAVGKDTASVTEGNAYRQGQNRWDNGYNVEFIAGYPQKIAGWAEVTQTVLLGIPRAVVVWRDNLGAARIGVGTESHLYYVLGDVVTDITPLRSIKTGTLTDPITTTASSTLVVITDAAAQVAVGDWVFLSAASAVGGVLLNGWYNVEAISAGVNYTITAPIIAPSSAGPGGGAVTYKYPRVTLTDPFTTVSGSPVVTVTHVAHGAALGNYVVYSGATNFAGLDFNAEFPIASIVDADTYTINLGSNANASATAGGSVSAIYLVGVQQAAQQNNLAYGGGSYGIGAYSASGASSTAVLANGWTLAAYGNQLLSCPVGGTIYVYDPVLGGRSYALLNAPRTVNAIFVTPERFVIALGINGNAMELAWPDQNDYTDWTTSVTNTAESGRTMLGGSFLVGGIAVRPGVSLFFSDRCVFAMTYTGSQFIYSTLQSGDNCGLVSPTAVCTEAGVAYWFSDHDFFAWNGSAQAMQSDDIRAYVFSQINRQNLDKVTAVLNRAKKQVRFYYPSGTQTENGTGMIYQYDQQCWSPLNFGRSAATDANLLSQPVSTDSSGHVYFEEVGTDASGAILPWSLQMGLIDISNGDKNMDIMGFTPDFQTLTGSPSLQILTQYYPSQTPTIDGPYTLTTSTTRQDLRSDGKLFAFSLSDSEMGSDFRLGVPRVDLQPAGSRR